MKKITKRRKLVLDAIFDTYDVVAEGANVYICDMRYDYSKWAKKAVEYFGLPGEYMVNAGKIWEEHIHPDDRGSYRENIDALFNGSAQIHDMQYRAKAADGAYKMCLCRGRIIRDEKGLPRYFVGIIRNQTVGEAIDELTGLPNQAVFFRELQSCIDHRIPVSIMLMGTSHFSRINDLYGYDFGNLVLQHSARYINEMFKDLGIVFRLDGIKLAIISRRADISELEERYKQLQLVVRNTFVLDGKRIDLPVNGGALYLNSFLLDTKTVFSCLTNSYEKSKYECEGDFCVFENGLTEDARRKLDIVNEIRSAVTKDCRGFENYYQPIVDAHNGKLKGAEALIRWRDESGNLIMPNDFVPVLENDALFPVLGAWILRRALTDSKELLKEYPDFVININLSYAQIKHPDFVYMVKETVADTGFPPENLCLELTERCRFVDMGRLKNVLFTLRQEGITFALDDFGTGFSSISILKQLECDVVKIDRQLVKNINEDEREEQLVAAISQISSIYGAKTCIEGIETEEMAETLRKYSVRTFQGYYYSKPLPFGEFKKKIKEL